MTKKRNQRQRAKARKEKNSHQLNEVPTPTRKEREAVNEINEEIESKVPKKLPIHAKKFEILKAIKENQVIIVTGKTGCGKSTKLPQFLYEAKYAETGLIACTQPRRMAAWSLAKRVAKEMHTNLGELVGYKVRFEDAWNEETKILYLTDGSLVGACPNNLRLYSAIVVDEVHHRTITTDVLLGLLKKTLDSRDDLKVILSSATIDSRRFSEYFNGAPIINIDGSPFEVEVVHRPVSKKNYPGGIVKTLVEIVRSDEKGDVLVFLPGKNQIEKVDNLIRQKGDKLHVHLVHAHAELSGHELRQIYKKPPDGLRKVILATNIAETSLTIETIVFVIDSGFKNIVKFHGKSGYTELSTTNCSKAEAEQRKGRCGRTQNGKCYRLFEEDGFLKEREDPEVDRLDLSSMVLQLKSMGYHDVRSFDFLEPPNLMNLKAGHDNLHRLKALDKDCKLTRIGRKMSNLPLDPNLAAVLIKSAELGCSEEVLRIVSLMSAVTGSNLPKVSPYVKCINPKTSTTNPSGYELDDFVNPDGETCALGDILTAFFDMTEEDEKKCRKWCKRNRLNDKRMYDASYVYDELVDRMDRLLLPVSTMGEYEYHQDTIAEAFLEGFFYNLSCTGSEGNSAVLLRNQRPIKVKNYLMSPPPRPSEFLTGCNIMIMEGGPSLLCLTRIPQNMDDYKRRLYHNCSHIDFPNDKNKIISNEEKKTDETSKTNLAEEKRLEIEREKGNKMKKRTMKTISFVASNRKMHAS